MQVTITLLPVSLSLVHIPRSRLTRLTHPVLRQILQPNPAFLNITCNEIELSIFTEHDMLHDFEVISRRDRHRRKKSRLEATSNQNPSSPVPVREHVEISYEKWNVLQIDSHNDQIGKSGTRVHDFSAPLADAGISILYQSSYMSDFIFVKEARIQEAMALFEIAGFHLYSNSPIPSHFSSTITDDYRSSDRSPLKPTHGTGAVLISGIDIPPTSSCESLKPIPAPDDAPPTAQQVPRSESHSPTSGEVRMLIPDLACVGLSDELGVDHWGLKIVKLVAFPDLIPSFHRNIPQSMKQASINTHLSIPHRPQSPHSDSDSPSISYNSGDDSDSVSSSSEDDGYFSYSPENASVASLGSFTSRSHSDLPSTHSPKTRSPSKHFCGSTRTAPLTPILPNLQSPLPYPDPPSTEVHKSISAATKLDSRVPFFSFTRTPEGSSLTADVHLLATLFPPDERYMVISSGELEAADSQLEGGSSSDESDELDNLFSGSDSLKCLQIDLRQFGLDKHGLVTRFSKVLEENDINHMYSSTFKTANILVDKKDAIRAQSLLRSC